MAHPQQKEFVQYVKDKFPQFFTDKRVLEIGSYNINGTMRDFFFACKYIGLDVMEGHSVDVVCKGHEYKAPRESFDTVLSCECFEHDPYWKETFGNMYRLVRPGGLLFFTCASTGRPEHGTLKERPQDSLASGVKEMANYYGNLTEEDFRRGWTFNAMFSEFEFKVNDFSCDLYFYGIKK